MLTDAWTQLKYHKQQSQLWRCKSRFVAVAAGRGSGKTELARRRVVRMLSIRKPWVDPKYFYALPTINQAKRVVWDTLERLIPPDWINNTNKSDMYFETKFGSRLYVLGMDKPHRAEGVQWDGGVIDESSDHKPGTFDKSLLPAFSHRGAWCWRIGVPKRYGLGAVEFKTAFDRGFDDDFPDYASFTWSSEDILSRREIELARESLDERDFNEQYRASWEKSSGAIFYAFNEIKNVDNCVTYNSNLPIIVGSDFNVDPMCWVLGQMHEKELHIYDEIHIRGTNTEETLRELQKRHGTHTNQFHFFGDAASRARKTSASMSDYLQIRNFEGLTGKRVFYPKANPPVVDRFAATNAGFSTASGLVRIKLHPRVKYLIADLNARSYKPGTREADDYGDIGHMTDALGYICISKFPLRVVHSGKGGGVSIG